MITINITKSKNDWIQCKYEEILHQLINTVPNNENRQKIADVFLIENIINGSIENDNLMQELANKLYEVGFINVNVHVLASFSQLHKDAQLHVEFLPKPNNQCLSYIHPDYLNVFVLSAESSIEYLEAQRLLEEENKKTNSFKNKSIEAIAIEQYINKIKSGAITIIKAKNFKYEFEKPQNTFIAFENSEQRKIRIGHTTRTHNNYSFEKDRQIVTALIAKRIAQLEMQLQYMIAGNNEPHKIREKSGLSARVVSKLKSFFLTKLMPIKAKKIKKSPLKLLQDLQLLNAVLDKVDASQWRLILRENMSLFKGCNDLPSVFKGTDTFLKHLYKCNFAKANIILEQGDQSSLQRVASAPTARAHALIQNHDLHDIVML